MNAGAAVAQRIAGGTNTRPRMRLSRTASLPPIILAMMLLSALLIMSCGDAHGAKEPSTRTRLELVAANTTGFERHVRPLLDTLRELLVTAESPQAATVSAIVERLRGAHIESIRIDSLVRSAPPAYVNGTWEALGNTAIYRLRLRAGSVGGRYVVAMLATHDTVVALEVLRDASPWGPSHPLWAYVIDTAATGVLCRRLSAFNGRMEDIGDSVRSPLTEVVIGDECGFLASAPIARRSEWLRYIDSVDTTALRDWLGAPNIGLAVYGAQGLLLLKRAGIPINARDSGVIAALRRCDVPLWACGGCLVDANVPAHIFLTPESITSIANFVREAARRWAK